VRLAERRDSGVMAIRTPNFVDWVADFISRFWPISKGDYDDIVDALNKGGDEVADAVDS
jgi:hypothetical protein